MARRKDYTPQGDTTIKRFAHETMAKSRILPLCICGDVGKNHVKGSGKCLKCPCPRFEEFRIDNYR
jgi:hypothetical protein